MKIKTISRNFDFIDEFDTEVNKALEEGWKLAKRTVIPATTEKNPRRLLYAELLQLDPAPEPDGAEAIKALHTVHAACLAQPRCDICPLNAWCEQLAQGGDPTDWVLPEVLDA